MSEGNVEIVKRAIEAFSDEGTDAALELAPARELSAPVGYWDLSLAGDPAVKRAPVCAPVVTAASPVERP
jgi:hypothetical protein